MITPKRIFIVGHMGAGKALFSEALAKKLGWQYIDANPSLERYIGKNLDDILGKEGVEAFHHCEAEIIAYYMSKEDVVVVMEESVIATEENRKLLSSECVVYLKVSTATQMERMKDGRSPLLPIADLKAFLDKQHLERDSLFEAVATLTIDSISVDEDVNIILKTLIEMGLSSHKKFSLDELLNAVEYWLVTGDLNPDILAPDFHFSSPFWKQANREEFLAQFADPKVYQETALSNITHFDPLLQFKGVDGNHFAIILQYHTKNDTHVYETVLGSISDGLLTEMRSIYDLAETKKAHDIEQSL